MASLGQLTLDLVARTGGYTGPIERAQNRSQRSFRKMERDAKDAAAGIAKVTAAAAAATAGLVAYAKIGMDNIDVQAKLARSLGTTIGDLRGISLAASDAGVEQGKLNSALMSYNKRLGDAARGTGEAQKAYKALGIDAKTLADMPLPEQMALISERISELDTAAERSSIADRLMSGGRQMVNLFAAGSDAIQSAVNEVEGLGLAINEVDATAVESANDSIARIGLVSESAQNAVAIGLAPALGDLADTLTDVAQAFYDGEYDKQVELLKNVTTVAGTAAGAYAAYRSAIAAATIAQWAFNAAVRANPVGALATVLGVAAGALITYGNNATKADTMSREASKGVSLLAGEVRGLTQAQIENQKAPLIAQQFSAQLESARIKRLQDEFDQWRKSQTGTIMAIPEKFQGIGRSGGTNARIAEQESIIKATSENLEKLNKLGEEIANPPKIETGAGDDPDGDAGTGVPGGQSGPPRAQIEQAKAADEATRAAERQAQAIQSLRDELYPLQTMQREFREDMELLAAADAAGTIDDLADAQARLREQNADAMAASEGLDSDAPSYGGLDASIGGAFGELGKIDEAQEQLQEWYSTQLEMLASFREQRTGLTEQWDAREREIKQQHEDELARIEQARQTAQLAAAESVFGNIADVTKQFAGEQSGIYQAMFAAQKAAAIAQSLIAIQQGIAMAAANPWPANLAAMASVAAATGGLVSNIASVAMPSGQAHDGIDSVPADGTWNLQKGERVTTAETSAKLDKTLADVQRGQRSGGGNVTVNMIEDKRRAGQTQERAGQDGQRDIDVFVADIMGDGPRSSAIRNKFGLTPQGR